MPRFALALASLVLIAFVTACGTPVPIASPPGAPTAVQAVAGDAVATVSWTAPASDGGDALQSYTVTSTPGGIIAVAEAKATTVVVTGLTNGTSYTFTVVATNAAGSGAPSAASNAATPATVPGAPTAVQAEAGDSSATVTWTAPVIDGGSAVTGYTVTSSPGGLTATATAPTTSATVTGLTDGTSYTFTVVATNGVGAGTPSAASNEVTPATVPGAPMAVEAVAGDGTAIVTWTAPAIDGGSAVTGYTVTSSPGGLTATATAPTTSATVTGLTDGTSYTFTVVATNVVGAGAPSAASNAVTPASAPGAPTEVHAVADDARATVSWTAPENDGGSAVTGYVVTSIPGGLTATAASPATSATVFGLANGTSYTFTVVAENGAGSSVPSAASEAVTPATVPAAPTDVTATASSTVAVVSWTMPVVDGGSALVGYTVKAIPGGRTASATAPDTTATVTGLTNGTSYVFIVVATNGRGSGEASAPSNPVVPATVPDPPTAVVAVGGDAKAVVSWTAPEDDGGSRVTGYVVTSSPGGITATAVAPTTTATVSGLENGTSYTFTVVATNAAGPGTASAPSSAVVPATVPDAPTAVTALATDAQATVSWTAPANDGGRAVTGYLVTSTPGALTGFAVAPETSAIVAGLTNGTSYTFTVVALNDAGDSVASAPSSPVTPVAVPAAPADVVATGGRGEATVTWSAPASDGGTPVTGYTVTSAPGGVVAQVAPPATTATLAGLTNGTGYTFTVVATNAVGPGASSAPSNEVVPATVPDAPVDVVAVGGDAQVAVSWSAPAYDGGAAVTGYTVTSSPGGATATVLVPATTATVTGLTDGTGYTFTVVATNRVGPSVASAPSAAVLPCGAGLLDCDGAVENGCETRGETDAANCGACGHVCLSGPNAAAACAGATCGLSCATGYGDCDGDPSDGCEAALGSDATNCGSCGHACDAGLTCYSGSCIAGAPAVHLVGTPTPGTVFNAIDRTFYYSNNLVNGVWFAPTDTIIVGYYSGGGYWMHPAGAGGYSQRPDHTTPSNVARIVYVPASNTLVYTTNAQYPAAAATQIDVARVDPTTGALSGFQRATWSDGFTGSCNLLSASATELLCFDGTAIRAYTTVDGSARLTAAGTVTLHGFVSDTCASYCYGGTFAWDGKYYYFADSGSASNGHSYEAYDASGNYVGEYSVADGGGVNGTYFDWSVGRYATHSGFGSRGGGSSYTWSGGAFTDDSQVYTAVSSQHSY